MALRGDLLRYAPGEDNGEWGDWSLLHRDPYSVILRTTEGTLLASGTGAFDRSTDNGQTWEPDVSDGDRTEVFHQSSLPGLRGPSGHGAVVAAPNRFCLSLDDGRAGSWACRSGFLGETFDVGEVPPSPALPGGRLLAAVRDGLLVSDDLGYSWRGAAGAYAPGAGVGRSLLFLPDPDHPYGGVALAGIEDYTEPERDRRAVVVRSDDGGGSWRPVWRYDPAAWGSGTGERPVLWADPSGAVWLSVSGGAGGPPRPGRILRSTDLGATWAAADGGLVRTRNGSVSPGYGLEVASWAAGPDGRVYVATGEGVWRTSEAQFAVAGEGGPEAGGERLGLRVWPNPSGGAATVAVEVPETGPVRVSVVDALGREVAVLHEGPLAGGQRLALDTSAWPVGTYFVRAVREDGQAATAALTVAR